MITREQWDSLKKNDVIHTWVGTFTVHTLEKYGRYDSEEVFEVTNERGETLRFTDTLIDNQSSYIVPYEARLNFEYKIKETTLGGRLEVTDLTDSGYMVLAFEPEQVPQYVKSQLRLCGIEALWVSGIFFPEPAPSLKAATQGDDFMRKVEDFYKFLNPGQDVKVSLAYEPGASYGATYRVWIYPKDW